MSYDLHIVRTQDWLQAASAPITQQDVNELVAADPELAWSATDFVEMREGSGETVRYPAITWNGLPTFWWFADEIRCSNPGQAQISKLVQMSLALNAYVIGDDGEGYPLAEQSEAVRLASFWQLGLPLLYAFLLGCFLLALVLAFF